MTKRITIYTALFSFLVLLCGCDSLPFLNTKKASPPSRKTVKIEARGIVIGTVGGVPLTLEDLNEDIAQINEDVSIGPESKIATREQKIKYVSTDMVNRALLYQEALNRGLDKDADITARLDRARMELAVRKLIIEETDKVEISAKEVEDFYNTYKEQLKDPEQRNIREIVVNSEQDAKDALVQLLQGADFATLAKEKSKAPSSKNGGDLGFLDKGKKFAQFDAVAFSDSLEVGRTSNIFKGPDGYYILKLEAKKGGKQKSLSEMYEDIKRILASSKKQQKIEDLISRLSKTNKVEINEGEIR